ncbi:hypothetical protein Lal_00018556 [Lupinus albus]|nr:hypothetical protein Lal_00018556 [Lupinus albus]
METWFTIIVSLCLIFLLRALLSLLQKSSTTKINNPFPPGPTYIPIITPIIWLTKSFSQIEPILKNLHTKYGPIVTLRIGSSPAIFINDRSIAHQVLVQNGSVFSDRPITLPTENIITSNQHNITSGSYGTTWRILRRNLTAEMLLPSRVKSFAQTRKWVIDILLKSLKSDIKSSASVKVVDHFQHAMFSLLAFMCFGQRVDDEKLNDIEKSERIFAPKTLGGVIETTKQPGSCFGSAYQSEEGSNEKWISVCGYFIRFEVTHEGQHNLDEGEMVTLCSEFLNAGTDTTSTALQWIMANLVKYPHMQQRIVDEITRVMTVSNKGEKEEVQEEDLEKLPYLKAVVLESLRRHPPGHFLVPHTGTEDVAFNGYLVPKNGSVNFMVAEIGRDPKVWEDPMTFKPERFLNEDGSEFEGFDITGSKEIKMMPFGVGRRICPAYNWAIFHLEYFVANLVWNFDWKVANGGDVDLSEKEEFTIVMKTPLEAHISPRI